MHPPILRTGSILALALLLLSTTAHAHNVKAFARADGDKVVGKAWMGGGGKVANRPVRVETPDGTLLLTTTTDDNGEFSFNPMQATDHVIIVESSPGHTARFVLKASRLPESIQQAGAPKESQAPDTTPQTPPTAPGTPAMFASLSPDTANDIRAIVRQEMQSAIGELEQKMAEEEEHANFSATMGGAGYLLGLAGIAFFFLGKRRNERQATP